MSFYGESDEEAFEAYNRELRDSQEFLFETTMQELRSIIISHPWPLKLINKELELVGYKLTKIVENGYDD